MRKKLGLIFLALITVISLLVLASCDSGSSKDNDDDNEEKLKHKYGAWVEEIPATCTNDGTHGYYYCSDCGKYFDKSKKELESLVIISEGHNFINDVCTKCDFKIVYAEGLEFELVNNEYYKVKDIGTCNDTELYIPKTYNNLTVKEIGYAAFSDCTSLTSIVIPNNVTYIDAYAFADCDSLISVEIPNSVTSIGDSAFRDCDNLLKITIPSAVTNISEDMFYGCNSLTSVTIPDSVTSIGVSAFEYCGSLASVTIPGSVTSIGGLAFSACEMLTRVTIEKGVTSIGANAFRECYSLTSIIIPSSVKSIGDYAFGCCTSLKNITVEDGNTEYMSLDGNLYNKDGKTIIHYAVGKADAEFKFPNGVTSVGYGAFSYSDNLTSIIIPDDVTEIDTYAFYGCDNLSSITLGKSISSIGDDAFYSCDKLVEVVNKSSLDIDLGSKANGYVAYYAKEVHAGTSKIVNKNDYLFYNFNGVNYLLACAGNETKLTLPASYNGENYEIYKYAFYDNDQITSVTIPDGVTSIGSYAFAFCGSLTSATIGNSVTSIGEDAFYNCNNLLSVTIGKGVTSIEAKAFEWCEKLVEIINKSSLNLFAGSNANGCVAYYAKEVHTGTSKIVNKNDYLFCNFNGVNYLLGYVGNETNLTLPASYNGENYEIYKYAFQGNKNLISITVSNGVSSIGNEAFAFCDRLKNVTIGKEVSSIGNEAFSSCDSLENVTFEDTSTWYIDETKIDVSNSQNNVDYFTSEYLLCNFYKK